jgi:hypothetical protein
LTPRKLAGAGLVFFCSFALVLAVLRRRLLANAYNRKLVGIMFAGSSFIVIERILAALFDIPVDQTLQANLWVGAMGVSACAIAVDRRLWFALPPLVVAAAITPVFPTYAGQLLALAFMGSFAVMIVVMWPRTAR